MILTQGEYLAHYGILRKSGRYPYGSGGPEFASSKGFLDYAETLRKQGLSETEIARGMGLESTTQLRAAKSIAKNEQKQRDIAQVQNMKDKGMSNMAIARQMGINESSVRSLLEPTQQARADVLQTTASMLKEQVAEKGYIDIGAGVEHQILGVSNTKLKTAVAMLEEEGYTTHYVKVEQLGTGKQTTIKVLAPPNTPYAEVYRNRSQIRQIAEFSDDGGKTFNRVQPPLSISSKRVAVRYKEDGGDQADGVIYVRPGVDDISLGASRYAQVRIAVDGSHYLKGMAMYKDDLPPGVDLLFNTNKSNTGNKLDAMKKMDDDPENPFGAVVRQRIVRDADGMPHVTSVMNIVGSKQGQGEEGAWGEWSKSLSSQMLSKQSPLLAKTQLDMTRERAKADLDDILALTNPVVKKKLLQSYADSADSAAVHLKAAALPRQSSHVILPISTLKDHEVYAPNYRNGERVVLIRFPHGGIFEIPELTVNNRHPDAKKALGQAKDAIGINHKVAERLSGADFDGDTVLVIPNGRGQVKTAPALAGLKDFDPKTEYKAYEGMPRMSPRTKQIEMGNVSNLITDMTIKGASPSELARAVRHSMVVIDAEKHNLNYKLSAERNGISALKKKYQGGARGGASTVISNSGKNATTRIPERKERSASKGGPIDPATGKKVYVNTNASYVNKDGKTVFKTEKAPKLAIVDDAHVYSSGTPIEKIYADHSNQMKALANQARRELVSTPPSKYSPSAKAAYASEVKDLDAKLNVALRNAPLERQAQVLANAQVSAKRAAKPDMDPAELKKIKGQALIDARARTGAGKERIAITEKEWAAIQAGAISTHKLNQILDNADLDVVKQLATPKTKLLMTPTKTARAKAMLDSGYTRAEVADALGVSVSTLKASMTEEGGS